MATSEIEISSKALLLIGDNGISAYDESKAGITAQALFPSVLENLLAFHLWRFATKQFNLSRLVTGPLDDTGYQYRFQLPAGYIRTVQVFPGVPYEIVEDKIHANVDELTLEYIYKPDVAAWPPWFVKLMEYTMAAELANPVTESAAVADLWDGKARLQLGAAMSIDSQQRPNVAFKHNPILEAHY